MTRRPRLHLPGGLYHVMLRGNNRQAIFASDADYIHLNQLVQRATAALGATVHAFCWMPNHIHLAVQVSHEPLGRLMQWIASRYAFYFNRQRGATGHVFERRYRAILVDVDAYVVQLVRYIHLNPVSAGLCDDPGRYPWSSHCAYMGEKRPDWLETKWVLSLFGRRMPSARRAFGRFVLDQTSDDIPEALIVGDPKDERLIGAERLLGSMDRATSASRDSADIDTIIETVCARHKISPNMVAGPARRKDLVEIRREIARIAYSSGAATTTEIGRALNRTGTAIRKLLRD